MRRQELEAFRGKTLPDLIGPGCRLLFVGINPSLWTVMSQTHFGHPGNRFYPALIEAGLVSQVVAHRAGITVEGKAHLIERGIGITNLVPRATARADELADHELREGAKRLETLALEVSPTVVAVAGITAFRVAFLEPKAIVGKQPIELGPSRLWVIPNPSGLNAHETVESLAGWMRLVGSDAGVLGPI